VQALQVDLAIETGAEFADDPLAGAVVDVSRAKIDEEDHAGADADQDSEEIRPKAKWASGFDGFRHQQCLKERC